MPEPEFSFEGTDYGKFELALGGAGTIKVDEPVESGKRIYFKGVADVVTTKLNKTRRVRTDIANVVSDEFKITKIEDSPYDEEEEEEPE